MALEDIRISDSFRKSTVRAVGAIVLFIGVYLLLIGLSLAFLVLCVYGGIAVISLRPSFATLMIGLGLIAMGVLVVIFLFKFLFHKHKSDLSHLTEVTREQEPALFALIDDLTKKVGTSAPRNVYLSGAVNASVFYDSSFWSMFLPVKKNLEVGMGLVNSVTVNELRAILAHEFGHFSQRSMKVGSYVYYVNRVIYNMLYENEGYEGVANSVARVNSYLRFFTKVAIKIVQGIQWVLRKVYAVVNLNYLKLSREMEFHADEVAARTTGSKPLADSLPRLDLAYQSLDTVNHFYKERSKQAIRADNLFKQQVLVLDRLGKDGRYEFQDGLPQVRAGQSARFIRSKLVFTDQWASHPSNEDRVSRLNALAIPETYHDHALARTVFRDAEATERMLSDKHYADMFEGDTVTQWDVREFEQEYRRELAEERFSEVFNGYYDVQITTPFDQDKALLTAPVLRADQLFDDLAVQRIYDRNGMSSDLSDIDFIGAGNTSIKQFEYDGQKYKVADCAGLTERLTSQLETLKAEIESHDQAIYRHFQEKAAASGKGEVLQHAYREYFRVDKLVDELDAERNALVSAFAFMNEPSTVDKIESSLEAARPIEATFKERLSWILNQEDFQPHITPQMREDIQRYIDNQATYFLRPDYQNHPLALYLKARDHHLKLMWSLFREKKMALLKVQEGMM